jgi:hypothetical protein
MYKKSVCREYLHIAGLRGKAAQGATALEGVGVACETVVLDASQLRAACSLISARSSCDRTVPAEYWGLLTAISTRRNTTTSLAVNIADVLLERGVGHTASTVCNGAAGVLGAGSRGGKGDDGEEGDGELHFDGSVWYWYIVERTEMGYIAGNRIGRHETSDRTGGGEVKELKKERRDGTRIGKLESEADDEKQWHRVP